MRDVLAVAAKAAHVGNIDDDVRVQDVKDRRRIASRLLLRHSQSGVPRSGPPVRPSHQHWRQEHKFAVWFEGLLEIGQDGVFIVEWDVREGKPPENVALRGAT